ncbi:MAG: polyhydroxyalkanoate synthesis repressor PhaR [Rubrivivax sp.]|nr:polyhydroxyalkanoate synthesis repressor PhaR [Rubrivivax sp.]
MASTSAPAPQPAKGEETPTGMRVLKKYPNRRLYDTRNSSYITVADVKAMVMSGEEFEVRDAKSGEDLTRSILLQIILEEETGGLPMFSTQMLAQLIRFYGHAMQGMMGSFLEQNLLTFIEMQSRLAGAGKNLFEPAAYSPEAWAKLFQGQANGMPTVMNAYLEHSKTAFAQMQEQFTKASKGMFPHVPGFPPKT